MTVNVAAFEATAAGRVRACPPRLPFVLAVGITGHRLDAIPAGARSQLEPRLRHVLRRLGDEAQRVRQASRDFYANVPVRLIFASPLADGADQIAAEIALEIGYEIHAILPFARDDYRADLPDEAARNRLDALLAKATCVLELPGSPDHELEAYVMAGRATVAHSDVLVAVWDGLPPRGRGGTGEVVRLAIERATPVVHVSVDAKPTALRWSAFEPAVVTHVEDPATIRPWSDENVADMLTALFAPPPDIQEQAFIALFQEECQKRLKTRIEYPLLLAAAGVTRFRRHHWHTSASLQQSKAEWQGFCDACRDAEAISTPNGTLQLWYEWSDSLASHYAQSYRSGHVFNFVLGAAAVLLALTTLLLPEAKKLLAFAEFGAIVAILANTWAGTKQQWHRRWLDYRQLAERIRPMRSLKVLGVASPDPPGSPANPVSGRWVEWYAAAVWRAVGCPSGHIDARNLSRLAATIASHELDPQIAYHRSTASQVEQLDRKLEMFGYALFSAALVGCVLLILGFWIAPDWVKHHSALFTLLSAGLPAVGTAVFGIRVQGDYVGSAVRSEHTARLLDQISGKLRADESSLGRTADLAEQAARAMLADLDEWRLLNQQHDLSVG